MPYSLESICSDCGLRHTFEYSLPVVHTGATITYGEVADKLAADLNIDGKIFPIHPCTRGTEVMPTFAPWSGSPYTVPVFKSCASISRTSSCAPMFICSSSPERWIL